LPAADSKPRQSPTQGNEEILKGFESFPPTKKGKEEKRKERGRASAEAIEKPAASTMRRERGIQAATRRTQMRLVAGFPR